MRAALVNEATNVVENVILLGPGFVPPEGFVLVPSETAGPGDLYDPATGAFTPGAPVL